MKRSRVHPLYLDFTNETLNLEEFGSGAFCLARRIISDERGYSGLS